jgi:phosphatidate cytidylyltransferase
MQRLLTAAVAGLPFLAGVFLLPAPWFFALIVGAVILAAIELVRIVRPLAPAAPLRLLPALVAAAAIALYLALAADPATAGAALEARILAAGLALSAGVGCLVLFGRTPAPQALPALGAFSFGTVYLALPAVALTRLQEADPWLVLLLLAIVWLGDTAALVVGRRWGRHKMAPRVSPKKSWEGAAASLGIAVVAAAAWSALVLGRLSPLVVAVAAGVNVAAQLGDLTESLLKRGSGVKDSGDLLPGHGGLLDRIDALLFAAPVLWISVLLAGDGAFRP